MRYASIHYSPLLVEHVKFQYTPEEKKEEDGEEDVCPSTNDLPEADNVNEAEENNNWTFPVYGPWPIEHYTCWVCEEMECTC